MDTIEGMIDHLESIRKEVDEAIEALKGWQAQEKRENKGTLEEWQRDRVELWCRIYNEGSTVTRDKLHSVWKSMGKDVRGLGGFFCGKAPSFTYNAEGKGVLTSTAAENVEFWTGKPIAEYAQSFTL